MDRLHGSLRLWVPTALFMMPGCFDAADPQFSEGEASDGPQGASTETGGHSTSDPEGDRFTGNGVADASSASDETGTGSTSRPEATTSDSEGGGSSDSTGDGETNGGTATEGSETGTTGPGLACPPGGEGCACDVGASCDGALECSGEGVCLFPGMIAIPEGVFDMGCTILTDSQCQDDEYVQHSVDLSAYQIGRTEVSQAEYQECVADGECDEPTQNYDPVATPNLPVVRISWIMAQTYCQWQGSRLPTEAEWAKAARGTDSRKYPWGNAVVDCSLANYNACGGSLVDVDSYLAGASPYGALHMVGNVGEWVQDWYEAPFAADAVTDPVGPDSGDWKVTRSQPFSYGNQDIRASFRSNWTPSLLSGGIGVRCARDLPEASR